MHIPFRSTAKYSPLKKEEGKGKKKKGGGGKTVSSVYLVQVNTGL